MINSKKSGSYYTPPLLADFMVYHLFTKYKFKKNIEILEPSAGDGVFFNSLFNNSTFSKKGFNIFDYVKKFNIDAVEKNKNAIKLCKENTLDFGNSSLKINYLNDDFLEYWGKNKKKFDLIIGNPPYIKNQHLTNKQIKICEEIHKSSNLKAGKIKNIWTSFLVGGVQSLNKDGIICFVLPAEILQVIYAKELRSYLRENFQKIEIFAFDQLVFPEIEQDVIILICAKKQVPEVIFYQVNKFKDLEKPQYTTKNANIHRETLDKWSNYVLTDSELKFLDSFRKKLKPVNYYCRAEAGIVTAANNFFIVNEQVLKEYNLENISKPIVQRGSLIPPTLRLLKSDYYEMVEKNKPAFLLDFNEKKESVYSKTIQIYLQDGKDLEINKKYKCKLRDNWYSVPSIWKSEAFFTKRSNWIPKIIVNDADVFVTDCFYRIRMKDNNNVNDLAFSFCNTLTLIFAELEGRYYGGTVLELTPNEFKNLRVPFCKNVSKKDLNDLDKIIRTKKSIKEVLNYTDEIILRRNLKISHKDILKLRNIYLTLVKRRFKGNKANFD